MRRRSRPNRGAALLLAMVILTLVTTLAAGMVWQQFRAVEVEAAERDRVQAAWILNGALDWARLILREDARPSGNNPPVDHLGEPWAVPLAESRLSTFLAADRNASSDDVVVEAFLSGSIEDAQSRYNLRNVLEGDRISAEQLAVLQRLCTTAGLSQDVATTIASGLRATAAGVDGSAAAPLPPRTVDQLTWFGLDPSVVARLQPWVDLLPGRTQINVNTASREVIAAVMDLDLGTAQRLVQTRERNPFKTIDDIRPLVPPRVMNNAKGFGVASNHFIVRGQMRLGERVVEEESLVQRRNLEVVVLRRDRSNLHLGGK